MFQYPNNTQLIHGDCMEVMRGYPDGYFDLAVVDPPYGGGQHFNFRFGVGDQVYENRKPDMAYFDEVRRVSKHQIVWGGNYFTDCLPPSRFWICWQKGNPAPNFSDFELAWGSFDKVAVTANLISYGFNHADKRHGEGSTIHPTQKPVALYDWIYTNYAEPGQRILDTHLGSASSAIAATRHNFAEFFGVEIDREYYEAAVKRFKAVTAQQRLFI